VRERGYAPHTEKYGAFSPFFTSFSIFSFDKNQRGADYSGPKAQRNWGRMARNTQQWICRVCTRTAKTDFWAKKLKTIDFRWVILF